MELIERYIYAVIKNLPESERADVDRELRANIDDMLAQDYSEENIKNVLEQLGDPEQLADEYRGTKRYLIGPKYYPMYMSVLKLVVSIAAAVIGAVSVFSVLFNQPAADNLAGYMSESIAAVIQAAFNGAVGAAFWVTFIFAVIEKNNAKTGIGDKAWTIEKLPPKPAQTAKIPRAGIIVSLIFYVLWIGVLVMSPAIIGIYESGYGMTPLFDTAVLHQYLPLILALSAFGVFVSIVKFIYGRWNGKIAVLNLVMNLLNVFAVILVLQNDSLFNPAFIQRFSVILNIRSSEAVHGINIFIWAVIVLAVIGSLADSIGGFVKAYKSGK